MMHSFDVELATRYGVVEAILLNNLMFWIEKNAANDKHFRDGYYWTYNSVDAFKKLFPYATPYAIRTALKKLEEEGIIVTGNYNKLPMDRTMWYRFSENANSILRNQQIDLSKTKNAFVESETPIPDNKPYINTDSKTTIAHSERISASGLEDFFDSVWQMYPKKKGKGRVSKTKKQVLYRIGKDELQRCIERYVKDFKKEHSDIQFMMHGSTFFNSGYVDYLDENVLTKEETEEVKESGGINLWD